MTNPNENYNEDFANMVGNVAERKALKILTEAALLSGGGDAGLTIASLLASVDLLCVKTLILTHMAADESKFNESIELHCKNVQQGCNEMRKEIKERTGE